MPGGLFGRTVRADCSGGAKSKETGSDCVQILDIGGVGPSESGNHRREPSPTKASAVLQFRGVVPISLMSE